MQPLFAQPIPSRIETAFVLVNIFLVSVKGPMRRRVGDVLKEWGIRKSGFMLTDVASRLIADGVGIEEIFVLDCLVLDIVIAPSQRVGIVETPRTDNRAVKLIETALQWPGVGWLGKTAGHMPFSAHVTSIAAGF